MREIHPEATRRTSVIPKPTQKDANLELACEWAQSYIDSGEGGHFLQMIIQYMGCRHRLDQQKVEQATDKLKKTSALFEAQRKSHEAETKKQEQRLELAIDKLNAMADSLASQKKEYEAEIQKLEQQLFEEQEKLARAGDAQLPDENAFSVPGCVCIKDLVKRTKMNVNTLYFRISTAKITPVVIHKKTKYYRYEDVKPLLFSSRKHGRAACQP